MRLSQALLYIVFTCICLVARAQEPTPSSLEKFSSDGTPINARVFLPSHASSALRSAIVLFHGGGWNEGDASWMDAVAKQYSDLGMVAISVDYRLSGSGNVTPFDAVSDARNAIRWIRQESARLAVNPKKIVVLGTSSGAHLAASSAIFSEPGAGTTSSVPNALILRSPAISVGQSSWFQKLTGGKAQAAALSPDLHIHAGLPPMILLQGEMDNVTPAKDAIEFCKRMHDAGNTCVLKIYKGVGHLFTRNLQQQEIPDYAAIDKESSKLANESSVAFLRELGFIE